LHKSNRFTKSGRNLSVIATRYALTTAVQAVRSIQYTFFLWTPAAVPRLVPTPPSSPSSNRSQLPGWFLLVGYSASVTTNRNL